MVYNGAMSFLNNLTWRYATKKFNNQKINIEQLQKIKDTIRLTPSSFGVQPYHVVIIENQEVLQKLKVLAPNNDQKIEKCSHLLIFCARTDIQNRFISIEKLQGRPKGFLSKAGFWFEYFAPIVSLLTVGRLLTRYTWSMAQTYIALGFAMAACTELEVDSCAMEGFNASSFRKVLSLPSHVKPIVLLAIGYRDPTDTIFPKTRFPENDLFTEIK